MYAEEDESDPTGGSFHRTVFLFACRKSDCMKPGLSKSVLALRCGLPKINPFYAEIPATEDSNAMEEINHPLCGCSAPSQCFACKKTFYYGTD